MKLIHRNGRIAAQCTDDYLGPDEWIVQPIDFDIDRLSEYVVANGIAEIPALTKAEIWEQIKAYRDNLTQTGGYLVDTKWYHSDTFSRTQQLGLVMMGASVPPVSWKTMDGTFVTMTQTLAGQIFSAAATQDQTLFSHAESLHADVEAATDPTTVDITAGWPATYGV